MAQCYITALFAGDAAANTAKTALAGAEGLTVERVFIVHRDDQGFHVDGRYAGELPHGWFDILRTALARVLKGASREEDSVVVSDAEDELGLGQTALIALIDERVPGSADAVIRACSGTSVRADPKTLDAEDTERFFAASSIPGFVPKPLP